LTWSLDHYKTTLAIVLLLFFAIALIPAGFIGGIFCSSDSGEFLVQIEMPKDFFRTDQLYDTKSEAFLKPKSMCNTNYQ
jgi:HAE1 family hydrophobic/amphiphilic exporter-1